MTAEPHELKLAKETSYQFLTMDKALMSIAEFIAKES